MAHRLYKIGADRIEYMQQAFVCQPRQAAALSAPRARLAAAWEFVQGVLVALRVDAMLITHS